ncbi:VRR-NUC domain-containing protein [Aliagarivorans marinus]|uniref:VRR-NUC domain-containing protein n=1 Tax=Aliagarivorans marinus TaxID=561965 RepID=UPI000420CD71|nr:VRR-NUC domain-containing protein [Aliagarivorans marinus]
MKIETAKVDDPFYYLQNLQTLLGFVTDRYWALFSPEEQQQLTAIDSLTQPAQAVLCRMVMRKGELFRESKLQYPEIADTAAALNELGAKGLVTTCAKVNSEQLASLLTKAELLSFARHTYPELPWPASLSKPKLTEQLQRQIPAEPSFPLVEALHVATGTKEIGVQLLVDALFVRVRLLFFGNLYQDWSEFVTTELGHRQYERVDLTDTPATFDSREVLEAYIEMHQLAEQLEQADDVLTLWPQLPWQAPKHTWLDRRRSKLLFQAGRQAERQQQYAHAIEAYRESRYPEAAVRWCRVSELSESQEQCYQFAEEQLAQASAAIDKLRISRIYQRSARKLKQATPLLFTLARPNTWQLDLPQAPVEQLERSCAAAIGEPDAPCVYVENLLFNGLFGLLFWPAIFAPVRDAFFHPFQAAPADMYSRSFSRKRQSIIDDCFALLEQGQHGDAMHATLKDKQGLANHFIYWEGLSPELLDMALRCIPAPQLELIFRRMLQDLRQHRSGFPDLIQFYPASQTYRLIEIKGPNDRPQDNQRLWLDLFAREGIDASVCNVSWPE